MSKIKQWQNQPEMSIEPDQSYTATLITQNGDIVIQLFADQTPITVNNFVFLAQEGYYDNTIFHRVISNFMVQGGDPTATGRGDPGYRFEDEFDPQLKHDKPGVVSMANAGPNTNGAQFFITHVETPWLDGKHSVFGQVIEGLDVLMSIPERDPSNPDNPGIRLMSVTIEEG
ncbi:MAG: peptidylprolyl isomerase [Chloroflexota bacterium]|nr:peptidylprolyl isomerase [Chloroflexota bacterium]